MIFRQVQTLTEDNSLMSYVLILLMTIDMVIVALLLYSKKTRL
jgi:hypothetical protein